MKRQNSVYITEEEETPKKKQRIEKEQENTLAITDEKEEKENRYIIPDTRMYIGRIIFKVETYKFMKENNIEGVIRCNGINEYLTTYDKRGQYKVTTFIHEKSYKVNVTVIRTNLSTLDPSRLVLRIIGNKIYNYAFISMYKYWLLGQINL